MTHRYLLPLLSFVVFSLLYIPPAVTAEISRPLTFSGPQYQVEDLRADLHSDGRILVVSGKIKNLGFASVTGVITVYFKGARHEVLKSLDTDVNSQQPIAPGQSGPFEASAYVQSVPGLANVSVEFTETGMELPKKKPIM